MSDKDKKRGLYRKYDIKRTDGSSEPPYGKHANCRYFVLDLDHDKFALPALRAYANHCRHEFPQLAADLDHILDDRPAAEKMEDIMDDNEEE